MSNSKPDDHAKTPSRAEIQAFQAALDKVLAKLRERAAMEWAFRAANDKNPADDCIQISVTATTQPQTQHSVDSSQSFAPISLAEQKTILRRTRRKRLSQSNRQRA